jgi:hypothetical protein
MQLHRKQVSTKRHYVGGVVLRSVASGVVCCRRYAQLGGNRRLGFCIRSASGGSQSYWLGCVASDPSDLDALYLLGFGRAAAVRLAALLHLSGVCRASGAPLTPGLGAIPNGTDDHTAKSLPVVWTNNVLVTVIPAAMIVAMVVIVIMVVVVVVMVVVVLVLVFIFVLLANLDQVGEIQRSK